MVKVNQIKVGSILSYVQMFIQIIIGLIYTPVIIRLLGKSEYGLYGTVSSTISMVSILSLGFNAGYIKYFSKYKKEEDSDAVNKLNGLYLTIFIIIGLVALLCGVYLTNNLTLVFDTGLTDSEYSIAKVLMLLLTLDLSVSFPMSVFQHIISAQERFIFLKSLGMVKTILSPLITLPLLLAGFRSIGMVSVSVGINLLVDVAYIIYVFSVLKCKFVFHDYPKGIFREIFSFTFFIALNIIIDRINLSVDNLILARYKGTIAVAVYSVGSALHSYYQLFSTSISGFFTPRIHKIYNQYKNNTDLLNNQFTNLFIKIGRLQYMVLSLLALGIVFFGKRFIFLWVGEGYEESYYVALLLVLPSTVSLIENVGIEIQRAENKHQFRSIAYFFMAMINFCTSIFLAQKYGAVGAAFGTTISLVVANGFIMNIYYHKKCHINIIKFWKNILSMSIGLLIPIAVGVGINLCIDINSFVGLILIIMFYCAVYFSSMWFFGMNAYEKNLIHDFVIRFNINIVKVK